MVTENGDLALAVWGWLDCIYRLVCSFVLQLFPLKTAWDVQIPSRWELAEVTHIHDRTKETVGDGCHAVTRKWHSISPHLLNSTNIVKGTEESLWRTTDNYAYPLSHLLSRLFTRATFTKKDSSTLKQFFLGLTTAVPELMIHDLPPNLLYLQHTRTLTPEPLLQIVMMHKSFFVVVLICFLCSSNNYSSLLWLLILIIGLEVELYWF